VRLMGAHSVIGRSVVIKAQEDDLGRVRQAGREGGREGGGGGGLDDEVIVAGLAPPTVSFPFCHTGRARAVPGVGELWRAYRGGCGRDRLCIRRREKEGQIPV
jgi:hypothetical protein